MPRMEVLDLSTTVRGNSTLELVEDLYCVAAERFSNPEVASLRSIIISVFNSAVAPGTDGSKIGQAWHECCDNALRQLRVLVPEVKISTATTAHASINDAWPFLNAPNVHNQAAENAVPPPEYYGHPLPNNDGDLGQDNGGF